MTISLRYIFRRASFRFILSLSTLTLGLMQPALAKEAVKSKTNAPALTQALLIRFETKVGAEKTVEDLLKNSQSDIVQEKETKQWFAFKMDGNHFAVFHSFDNDAERKAHLDSSSAMKLSAAKDAFAKAPTMEQAEILAAKTSKAGGKALVKKALIVVLEAKSGKEAEVESFLKSALPLVNKEAKTLHWYAIKLSANTYGIVDTFADDAGRDAHLKGKIADSLNSKAPDLLQKAPLIEKVDVIASKI